MASEESSTQTREVDPGCLMFVMLVLLLFTGCDMARSLAKIADKPACVAPAPPPAAGGE